MDSSNGWVLPYADLTPDQQAIVELPLSQHRVIFGPPGSGKTQVLLHRAAHLAQAYGFPEERYQIFLYTNVLKEYIRSGLTDLGLSPDVVSTLDSWCCKAHERHIGYLPRVRGQRSQSVPDFSSIRSAVLDWLNQHSVAPEFDFVVVDEGQDLPEVSFQILRRIARHITVFGDDLQQIYEDGASVSGIFKSLSIPTSSRTLLSAYRNSPRVARLASYFLENDEQRDKYLARQQNLKIGLDKPLFYVASTYDQEMDRLAEIIDDRVRDNKRVGVIVTQNRLVYGYANAFSERGVNLEKVISSWEGRNNGYNFQNGNPKITNIYNAKGLTFDVVILPHLRDSAFREQLSVGMRKRLLFVAASRAMEWVCISMVEGDPWTGERNMNVAVEQGDLHRQTYRDVANNEPEDFGEELPF